MKMSPSQGLAVLTGLFLFHCSIALKVGAGPAPAAAQPPAPAPGPAPAPAPPAIRPGIKVQITKSNEALQRDFKLTPGLLYDPLMEEMVGKTFVVRELNHGGVGLPSPDGSQDDVWYFPVASLTPWLDTPEAKEVPIAGKAAKIMGSPTRTKVDVAPPGRHDAPWEYRIKGRNLINPVAPPMNQRVDLKETSMPMPPWRKVKQVVDVGCMEKLHKDPTHICDPEHYKDFNMVTPAPVPEKLLSEEEGKQLKRKIKHLQRTIDSLTPEAARKKVDVSFKVPRLQKTNQTMISSASNANPAKSGDRPGKKMKVGAEGSDERLHSAHEHGEKLAK